MDKKIVKEIAWAFARQNQPEKALATIMELGNKERDGALKCLVDYYLDRIILRGDFSQETVSEIARNFRAAFNACGQISAQASSWPSRRKIIDKGLKYLEVARCSFPALIDIIYQLSDIPSFLIPERDTDAFFRKIMKEYLAVSELDGREIFKISERMSTKASAREAEVLLDIFIRWGDYGAIKAIGDKYGRLNELIYERSEEIFINCLKRKGTDMAAKVLPIIKDEAKRGEYADLLGVRVK